MLLRKNDLPIMNLVYLYATTQAGFLNNSCVYILITINKLKKPIRNLRYLLDKQQKY